MFYCINNNVIFDPSKHTLTSSKFYPEKDTKLNQPTSRCLSLLIEKKGCVITQEDFMNEVWRKHGMEVTVNTLYQNISILRKTLKRVGIEENIIITVPKKGITLTAQVEERSDKKFAPTPPHLTPTPQAAAPLKRKGGFSLFLVLWIVLLLALVALALTFHK